MFENASTLKTDSLNKGNAFFLAQAAYNSTEQLTHFFA